MWTKSIQVVRKNIKKQNQLSKGRKKNPTNNLIENIYK